MALFSKEAFDVIADAQEDRDDWLQKRETLLTSSDIFTFREVAHPDWWGSTRDEILAEKVRGIPKEFTDLEVTSMAHGSFDEENIARKLGHAIGAEVQTVNWLCVNERWGNLGASIDGFIGVPRQVPVPFPHFCQDRTALDGLANEMIAHAPQKPFLLEIKKSTSVKWQHEAPHYYSDAQMQAQLHILDLPYGVIVGETIKQVWHRDSVTGRKYPRKYWDLRAYFVVRQPGWACVLDEVNEEFEKEWERWNQ